MLATPARELPRDDGRWAYELKWDGVRALVFVEAGQVRVRPRWPHLHFVEPVLVCEVEFTEWTEERTLRHPVFKGLRESSPHL